MTREGQVRSGDRHEKDDRSRVDDPRSWVLGWANERKIAALTDADGRAAGRVRRGRCRSYPRLRDAAQAKLAARLSALDGLAIFRSWTDVDWEEAEGGRSPRTQNASG